MRRRPHGILTREQLIEALAVGAPLSVTARSLGYSERKGLRVAMARLGVERCTTSAGVVVVVGGKARA
jgi:hypothetical protein